MLVLGLVGLTIEGVLGFGIAVLTTLMVASLAVWFVCSIAENILELKRRTRRPDYDALARENDRLRGSLADAREENDYLRKLYRNRLPRSEDGGQDAA